MTSEEIKAEIEGMHDSIKNHCPFGCAREDLDEHGYCSHLVGFTNDGAKMEVIEKNPHGRTCVLGSVTEAVVEEKNGKQITTIRRHDHRMPVLPTDTLVNPESVVHADGTRHLVKAWVSSRVYRKLKPQTKAG